MKKKFLLFIAIISAIFFITGNIEFNQVNAETLKSAFIEKSQIGNSEWDSLFENVESDKDAPDSYRLFQNYPNPFNPTTIIKYSIPEENHITLKVYNSLGNEVLTLVDQNQSAGFHRVVFNGENLSSGVYYAQLRADRFVKVIKMLLVK